jgi:L-galactose dehydrogenase
MAEMERCAQGERDMEYTTLGRTGLNVSVAGLGCGGNSRVGIGAGKSIAEAADIIRAAFDLGVTYIDTARLYGTEPAVGLALKGRQRDKIVISTKSTIRLEGERISPDCLANHLDESLSHLQTDYVDVFFLHGVSLLDYDYARDVLAPALLKERDKGKFRYLGITEPAANDPEQLTIRRAVDDEKCWDVMMLAFHMLHQTARANVFPKTQAGGIGTVMMYVVRNIFSRPGLLVETVRGLIEGGKLSPEGIDPDDPLGFLEDEAESLIDAAYRFSRHQKGADTVLFGTGNVDHLKANIESILRPSLPEAYLARLHALFGHLTGVGLDSPEHLRR